MASAQTVAFTFDDGLDPRTQPLASHWNQGILSALGKAKENAMFFPAGRIVDSPEGRNLVAQWYGFRPNRSAHDALDALIVGIKRKRVNWVLDLDVRDFFGTVSHESLIRFLEHRIGDQRLPHSPVDSQMAEGRGARRIPTTLKRSRTGSHRLCGRLSNPDHVAGHPASIKTVDKIAGYVAFRKAPPGHNRAKENGNDNGNGNANDNDGPELQLWTVSDGNGLQVLRFTDDLIALHKDLLEEAGE